MAMTLLRTILRDEYVFAIYAISQIELNMPAETI